MHSCRKSSNDCLTLLFAYSDEVLQGLREAHNSSIRVLDAEGLEYVDRMTSECGERSYIFKKLSKNLQVKITPNKGGNPAFEKNAAMRETVAILHGIYTRQTRKKVNLLLF